MRVASILICCADWWMEKFIWKYIKFMQKKIYIKNCANWRFTVRKRFAHHSSNISNIVRRTSLVSIRVLFCSSLAIYENRIIDNNQFSAIVQINLSIRFNHKLLIITKQKIKKEETRYTNLTKWSKKNQIQREYMIKTDFGRGPLVYAFARRRRTRWVSSKA